MRSRRPWCFSHPTTAAMFRERNCLLMADSRKCRQLIGCNRYVFQPPNSNMIASIKGIEQSRQPRREGLADRRDLDGCQPAAVKQATVFGPKPDSSGALPQA